MALDRQLLAQLQLADYIWIDTYSQVIRTATKSYYVPDTHAIQDALLSSGWELVSSGYGQVTILHKKVDEQPFATGTRMVSQSRNVIEQAMLSGNLVWIRYRNSTGSIQEHMLVPQYWKSPTVFAAYPHSSKKELYFNVDNILECELLDHNDGQDVITKQATYVLVEVVSSSEKPKRLNHRSPATEAIAEPFDQVHDGNQWSRLIRYYRQCLVTENRQQYIVERQKLHTITIKSADTDRIMSGTGIIRLDLGSHRQSDPLLRFLRIGETDNLKQLCVGYPLLTLDDGKVAPLIYCQAVVDQQDHIVTLRAESPEISYAALKHFGFNEEEIGQFLVECSQLLADNQRSQFQALEDVVVGRLREMLQVDLPRSEDFLPYTLLDVPGLFWVDAKYTTAALIQELDALSQPESWQNTPQVLKHLLSATPEHEYPRVPSFQDDPATYITPVNDSQRRAVRAATIEPLSVVTGPPGTGKSQLVLNLVANAFLHGETVLFASYNNHAVDVVMDRLLAEVKFPGAIRTGKKSVREQAGQFMNAILDSIATSVSTVSIETTREWYEEARLAAIKARDELDDVQSLQGLLESRQVERQSKLDTLGVTAKRLAKQAESTVPEYRASEVHSLQLVLDSLQDQLVPLKARRRDLALRTNQVFVANDMRDPSLTSLRKHIDQWGTFGDDLLKEQVFEDVWDLTAYLERWQHLLPALEGLCVRQGAETRLQIQTDDFRVAKGAVSANLAGTIEAIAESHSIEDLDELAQQLEITRAEVQDILEDRFSWWQRVLIALQLRKPLEQATAVYQSLAENLIGDGDDLVSEGIDPSELLKQCEELLAVSIAAQAYRLMQEARAALSQTTDAYDQAAAGLPIGLQEELTRVSRMEYPSPTFRSMLSLLQQEVADLQEGVNGVARQLNDLLDSNVKDLRVLYDFRAINSGGSRGLWSVKLPARLVATEGQIRKWHHLLAFWAEDAAVKHLKAQLDRLPDEQTAAASVRFTEERLRELGGQLMRDIWFDRAKKATNQTVRAALDYANSWRSTGFSSVLNLFPVWATTNLSTKSNFPLSPELFDLLIIDEASQCDIPSALPLLYRAKRAVIIGDPNQLRHIATISGQSDLDAAEQVGVNTGAFLYSEQSLFDLAQRSVGTAPGVNLLNEHYRSDNRIISFSNREFYDNQLAIKTNLARNGFSKEFLNDYGGMYWLNINGIVSHPRDGSAFNEAEIFALQQTLPRLVTSLAAHGLNSASIGVVTPYRAQRDRIDQVLRRSEPLATRVQVGTAHTYQGDERDFMVFSTVLAPGIGDGSLEWLARTKNLLNVAITRARVALIVIGDWDFCHSQPKDSYYRRLADYVTQDDKRLYRQASDVPLFGGPVAELVGVVLDPHNPEFNRTTLRRFLTSCREYIWWLDVYFSDSVIKLWRDVFDDPTTSLRQVRLLAAAERTVAGPGATPNLKREAIKDLQRDLASRGIEFEVRVIPKRDLGVHDRFLFYPGRAINMPPIGGVIEGHSHVAEYTSSSLHADFFDSLWNRADTL